MPQLELRVLVEFTPFNHHHGKVPRVAALGTVARVAIVFGYRCECGAVGVLWALFSRDLNLVDQTPVCTHHCLLLGLGRGLGLAVAASVGLGHGSELHLTLPKPLTATLCTA